MGWRRGDNTRGQRCHLTQWHLGIAGGASLRQPTDVDMLLNAASANSLPLEEVMVRLGIALRLHLEWLASRERRHIHTPTGEMMAQEIEALANAIFHLQFALAYASDQCYFQSPHRVVCS